MKHVTQLLEEFINYRSIALQLAKFNCVMMLFNGNTSLFEFGIDELVSYLHFTSMRNVCVIEKAKSVI